MEGISEDAIAKAAGYLAIYAFDEGTPGEIRESRDAFNQCVQVWYGYTIQGAMLQSFHRPTLLEFRKAFTNRCHAYLRDHPSEEDALRARAKESLRASRGSDPGGKA